MHPTLGIEPLHQIEQAQWEHDKSLGETDVSKCLPGWIESFCDKIEKGEGMTLSPAAVRNLGHTLMAARARQHRLIKERDEK